MRNTKIFGCAMVMILGTIFGLGANAAMATNAYKYTTPSANDALGAGITWHTTLQLGTSTLIKDTLGGANDTCPELHLHGDIGLGFPSPVWITLTSVAFTKCSHTTTTLKNGSLEIKNIAGTTNGTVVSKEMRVTMKSTIFGISCVANTGAGTTIGTITGAKSSSANAVIDLNGVLTMENGCGDSTWTGTMETTAPTGMTIEAS